MLQSEINEKVHECQTCGKKFKRRSYLQLHEKIHGEKCYKCNICEKSFRQPAGLWIHKKHQSCLKRSSPSNTLASSSKASDRIDEGTKPGDDDADNDDDDVDGKRHKCDICDRRFSQKHLLTYHKRTHTGEYPFPCTVCGKMFRGTATLKYHERTHTGYKPHKCIFCEKSFTQLGSLRLHSRKEHQSEKVYECDTCKEQFEKFREVSSHQKTHTENISQSKSSCSAVPGDAPLDEVRKNDDQRHDEGTVVGYKTSSNTKRDGDNVSSLSCTKKRKRVEIHDLNIQSKTNEMSMTDCKITSAESESSCSSASDKPSASMNCEEFEMILDTNDSSSDEQVPESQVKQQDENGNKYECNICNREFSQAHVLKHHKKTHSGENAYPCSVCGKTFRSQGALTVHQRTHNGQRPYKCIYCPLCFTQRNALLQHCRRIHFSDEIYECSVCQEKFEKYRDLSSHTQTHSDTACTMVTQLYDQVNFTVEEDELKPLKELESDTSDLLSSPSPLDLKMEDTNCDEGSLESAERSINGSHDDDDEHVVNQPNSTEEQEDTPSSGECLSVIHRIKKEKQDYDSSNDSGISPDTSPSEVNVESDSIYEVHMQPIEIDYKEKNCLSVISNKRLQTTGNLTIFSQESQTVATDVADEYSKSCCNDDQLSNSSRVTTPDNDHIFSSCCSDLQENPLWEKKMETSISSLVHRNKKWTEDISVDTMNYPFVENNNSPSNSVYSSADFELNTAGVDLIQEYSGRPDLMPFHSQVFNSNETVMHSDFKHGGSVSDSQVSNFHKHEKNFAQMNTASYSQNFVMRQNDNMRPLLHQGDMKLFGCRNRTRLSLEDLQQNPKCEYKKNGMKQICFKCDVLPTFCHLDKS